jgi:hypothetical protein
MRGLAALAVVLAFSVAGSAAAAPPSAVLRPTSSIAVKGYAKVIADGRRAAAVAPCGIVQWVAGQRKGSFTDPCRPLSGLDDSDAFAFALAGNRLAWLREEWVSHGMVVQTELVVKTGAGKPREIASAYDEYQNGTWLLSLAGGGDTLAAGWTLDSFDDSDNPVHDERIYRIGGSKAGPCPAAEGLLPNPPAAHLCSDSGLPGGTVLSASGGRILTRFYGSFYVADATGTVTKLAAENVGLLALSGSTVVAVRTGKQSALETYDAGSGQLLAKYPLPPLNRYTGVLTLGAGYALFASHGLHLVRIADGRDRLVTLPGGKSPVAGALGNTGLFLLYRTKQGLRLGFVPAAKL